MRVVDEREETLAREADGSRARAIDKSRKSYSTFGHIVSFPSGLRVLMLREQKSALSLVRF